MKRWTIANWLLFAAVVVAALALPALLNVYYVKLVCRIMIFGIAATGLSLLVVYGGMISLGHALFLGLGVYIVGILAQQGISSAYVVLPIAIAGTALVSLVIGAISLRSTGIYFIFVTLAFAQMFFYLAQSLRAYGGDDGFSLQRRMEIWQGVSAADTSVLYFVTLTLLIATLVAKMFLLQSRFGRALVAVRDNEVRASTLGLDPYRCKLVAFVISACATGLAGALLANLSGYISPGLFGWIVSGDMLVIVILGMGFTAGPIVGSGVFILFEYFLSDLTQHWLIIFGPLLVLWVLLPIHRRHQLSVHS